MLSKKDVLNMSNQELYNYLLPDIKEIYEKHKKEYSSDEFNTYVLNCIDEAKKKIQEGENFALLFKNNLLSILTYNSELSGTDSLQDYLKEISIYPLLTDEEEKEEFLKLKNGDESAKNTIINSNLRLVVYVAKMYTNRGISFEDLIQEGNLGLLKAIEKFDPDLGYKFSTYAFWWIKQAMTRTLANSGRTIRLPVHVVESLNAYNKTENILIDRLNRMPTHEEIASEMGIPLEKVIELSKYNTEIISLDVPVGEDQDSDLGSFIPSDEKTPDEKTFDKMLPEEVDRAIEESRLTQREKEVLMYRFGFYTGRPLTLEEVGKKYNVTRERIRQIEAKALIKLKKSYSFRQLSYWYLQDEKDYKKPKYYKYPQPNRNDSLYSLLGNYQKEKVDYIVSRLSNEEKRLVHTRFGYDLQSPNTKKLSKEESSKLFRVIIPKIKNMLNAIKGKDNKYLHVESDRYEAMQETKKMLCNYLNDDNQEEEQKIPEIEIVRNRILEKTNILDNAYKTRAYFKLLGFTKSKNFKDLLEVLPLKEAIIISLKLDLIDENFFTLEDVAYILNISADEVDEIIKDSLVFYKNVIINNNSLLENSIDKKLVK